MNQQIESGLGNRIRQLRNRFGLSIPEFAKHVGFTRSYIFRLENGEARNPSIKFCEAVVQKFGVDREWFIGGVGDGTAVGPFRSKIDDYVRMRLDRLQTAIDACTDRELVDAFHLFNSMAVKNQRLGKIFVQVADVISYSILLRAAETAPKKELKK
jgi:transcriptional regulator with XRE-family HTH domain